MEIYVRFIQQHKPMPLALKDILSTLFFFLQICQELLWNLRSEMHVSVPEQWQGYDGSGQMR